MQNWAEEMIFAYITSDFDETHCFWKVEMYKIVDHAFFSATKSINSLINVDW